MLTNKLLNPRAISISKELLEASKGMLSLGVVTAKVQVQKLNTELWDLLQQAGEEQRNSIKSNVEDIEQVKALRDTYKTLGLRLSDYKGSNESLLKRITSDKGVYQINTVVDINNYISVESGRSVGSYDLSKLKGDITFRKGEPSEKYLGTTNRSVNLKNLPILCDEEGPFGSPTSDSQRALIREDTTDIMTVIFSFDGDKNLDEQVSKLKKLFIEYGNGYGISTYIVKDLSTEFTIGDDLVENFNNLDLEKSKEGSNQKKFMNKEEIDRMDTKILVGYKLLENNKLCINLNRDLTGEIHGDMQELHTIEQLVNALKEKGLIKNVATNIQGDESLKFAYNGVKLELKEIEPKSVVKNQPVLDLRVCKDHFEISLQEDDNFQDDMQQIMGAVEYFIENN